MKTVLHVIWTILLAVSLAGGGPSAALASQTVPREQGDAEPKGQPADNVDQEDTAPMPQATTMPAFVPIGDLPGGKVESFALGVSGDGEVVVGQSESENGTEAFRWTWQEGMVGLGDLGAAAYRSAALAASYDGSVIVGRGMSEETSQRAFVWSADDKMQPLPEMNGRYPVDAVDVSADGRVICGHFNFGYYPVNPLSSLRGKRVGGFLWNAKDGYLLLPSRVSIGLRDFEASTIVTGLSKDGRIAAGFTSMRDVGADFQQASRWVEGKGSPVAARELREGPARSIFATRTAIVGLAGDGETMIGTFNLKARPGRRGFRLHGNNFQWLGDPDANRLTQPEGISGDARTIVGRGFTATGNSSVACIWREGLGIISVAEWLESAGISTHNWTLREATAVSQDGMTVVGWGTNPEGQTEGWIARIVSEENLAQLAEADKSRREEQDTIRELQRAHEQKSRFVTSGSVWNGILKQGDRDYDTTVVVKNRDQNRIQGNISYTGGSTDFTGTIDGDKIVFRSLFRNRRGNILVPTEYSGRISDATIEGEWEYSSLHKGTFSVQLR